MNTVLIVDDHPVLRLAVRMLLETNGFRVVGEVGNGIDAVQMFRDQSPDVVILDIGIPKLDGLSVIARMRGIDPRSHILVLTSLSSEARRSEQTGQRDQGRDGGVQRVPVNGGSPGARAVVRGGDDQELVGPRDDRAAISCAGAVEQGDRRFAVA
ncbi:hypothetical protein G6F31_018245 [Rhizopus arrhizus]|nr:hypothetical protein G6F31_018245 [Rhizopus arrhizus]